MPLLPSVCFIESAHAAQRPFWEAARNLNLSENYQRFNITLKNGVFGTERRLKAIYVFGVTVFCHFVLLGLLVNLSHVRELAQKAE